MHFLLLGANGRTGQRVVSEVLAKGHTAVALVRKPNSIASNPGIPIVTGSPLSKDDIRKALTAVPSQTVSAAIITLNAPRKSDSPFAAPVAPPRFLADSCANTCEVLEAAGIDRIVMMSTVGAGDSWERLPLLTKGFLGWTNVKYALDDHNLVDKEIRLTKMDWTLVRAARLRFDDNKEVVVKTLGSVGEGMGMTDNVSVANVARFMIAAVVEGTFVREAVVIRE